MTSHKKRTVTAVLLLEKLFVTTIFLPCGKHHSPAQIFGANRFLLGKAFISIKSIKNKII